VTASDAFFIGEGFKIDRFRGSMGFYNSSKSIIRYPTTDNTIR
jgi:hypothetical protein